MSDKDRKTSLKVSPEVVRLVRTASRDERLAALRDPAALPLNELLIACLFLYPGSDPELKAAIGVALRRCDGRELAALIAGGELHPRQLEMIARMRLDDVPVIGALLRNPQVPVALLKNLAAYAQGEVFSLLAGQTDLLERHPELVEALANNARVAPELKRRFGWSREASSPPDSEMPPEAEMDGVSATGGDETEAAYADESAAEEPAVEEENLSKYQQALEMPVAEKIKTALTGDKEWRTLLIKDPNKLVSSAVLKNPRITDGEVLTIAKSKTASDELIRLITLNNEWLKNYEIKRALVLHHRTPLPTAMRFMTILSEKDLKGLAKSRDVSSALVNTARRMLLARERKP